MCACLLYKLTPKEVHKFTTKEVDKLSPKEVDKLHQKKLTHAGPYFQDCTVEYNCVFFGAFNVIIITYFMP